MQTLQRVQKDHGDARRIQCGIVQLIYTNEKSFIHDLLGLKTNAGPVGSHNLLARLQIFDLFGALAFGSRIKLFLLFIFSISIQFSGSLSTSQRITAAQSFLLILDYTLVAALVDFAAHY